MRLQKIQAIAFAAQTAGSFQKLVESFVSQAMLLAAEGLSLAEIGQLFSAFVTLLVEAAEQLGDLTGIEKKQTVLDAVGYLFDILAPSIPLPFFLQPFRRWLRAPIKSLVLTLADGAIEAIVSRLPAMTIELPDLRTAADLSGS